MKKILELAEKYMDTASEHDYTELAIAIGNCKILEQTPITEDWMKEHGWRQCGPYGHQFVHPKCSFWLFGSSGFTCWEITKTEYVVDYGEKDCVFCEITTVAQLLDALELCNIKID